MLFDYFNVGWEDERNTTLCYIKCIRTNISFLEIHAHSVGLVGSVNLRRWVVIGQSLTASNSGSVHRPSLVP